MKRIKTYKIICLVLILSFVLPAVPIIQSIKVVNAATKIALNKKTLKLETGKTFTLNITGTKKKVTWATSNKSVASVTSKGKVKAIKTGTATITATVNKKNYHCKVTVIKKEKSNTTPTPSASPTLPPTNNPNVINAPFSAKEVQCGDFVAVAPKGWYTDFVETDIQLYSFKPQKNSTSSINGLIILKVQETDEPARNYDDLKTEYENKTNIEVVKKNLEKFYTNCNITNNSTKDIQVELGTAYYYTYTVSYTSDNKDTIFTQETYVLSIDNYLITLGVQQSGDHISEDIITYANYMIQTLEKNK